MEDVVGKSGKKTAAQMRTSRESPSGAQGASKLKKKVVGRNESAEVRKPIQASRGSNVLGISEVAEAYVVAVKGIAADAQDDRPHKFVQEKVSAFMEHLRADHSTVVG